jgi:hypothetical protein
MTENVEKTRENQSKEKRKFELKNQQKQQQPSSKINLF